MPALSTMAERMIGAAKLDIDTHEEVEDDERPPVRPPVSSRWWPSLRPSPGRGRRGDGPARGEAAALDVGDVERLEAGD